MTWQEASLEHSEKEEFDCVEQVLFVKVDWQLGFDKLDVVLDVMFHKLYVYGGAQDMRVGNYQEH